MANGIDIPEDYLRIGEPAANRQTVYSAIMDLLGDEDAPRDAGRDTAIQAPAETSGAIPTGGKSYEPYLKATEQYRDVPPPSEAFTAIPTGAGPTKEKTGRGFWEWKDEKGVRHATNKPGSVPPDVKATFKPFEEPTAEIEGTKLFGPATDESMTALGRAAQTDEQRRDASIQSIMKETGKPRDEAERAYDSSMEEVSGKPTIKPGSMEEYEQKMTDRAQVIKNIQGMMESAGSKAEAQEILTEGVQYLKLHGLDKPKKPEATEPTLTVEIEGQKVAIPASKYDKRKHGSMAADVKMPTDIVAFETVSGMKVGDRGSKKYRDAFKKFKSESTASAMTRDKWRLKMADKMAGLGTGPEDPDFQTQMKGWLDFYDANQPTTAIPTGDEGKVDAAKETWLKEAQRRNPKASQELLSRAYDKQIGR